MIPDRPAEKRSNSRYTTVVSPKWRKLKADTHQMFQTETLNGPLHSSVMHHASHLKLRATAKIYMDKGDKVRLALKRICPLSSSSSWVVTWYCEGFCFPTIRIT